MRGTDMSPLASQSVAQILRNTAAAVRDVAGEFPGAAVKGPAEVSAVIMREDRRAYIGIALAGFAIVFLLFF